MSARGARSKALVLAVTVLASLGQAVAQESGTEVSFEKGSTSSGEPVSPRKWEPNNLDLVADRNESILQFANISDAFKPGLGLTEESDEDQHNSSKVGSTDSSEFFDNHDDDTWTEIGLYGYFVGISGDVKTRNVTVDGDVSFSDILSNLDMGGMGFVQHHRGNWSFILDAEFSGPFLGISFGFQERNAPKEGPGAGAIAARCPVVT